MRSNNIIDMVHKQMKKIKTSEDINRKRDPMGRAISDYFTTGKAARLRVFSTDVRRGRNPCAYTIPHLR